MERKELARTIAKHLIDVGTENTTTGNWHFSFEEIDELFGTNLKEDAETVKLITDELWNNSDIIADIVVSKEEFDLIFYLDYCPYAGDDGFEHLGYY